MGERVLLAIGKMLARTFITKVPVSMMHSAVAVSFRYFAVAGFGVLFLSAAMRLCVSHACSIAL